MSQILNEMYSEDVDKAQDKLDKAKKIDALKQQIQKIKDEPTSEALDDDDKDTVKDIIKGLNKASGLHKKQAKQLTKDIEDETSQVAVDRLKRDKKAAQLKKDIKGIGEEVEDLEEFKKNYIGFDDPERSTEYRDIRIKAYKRYNLLYKDGHETDNKRLQDLVDGFCKEFKITKFEVWEIMETFGGTIEELYIDVASKFEYNRLSKKKAIEIFKLNNI